MSSESNNRVWKLVVIDSHQDTAEIIRTHFADSGIRVIGEAQDLKSGLRMVHGLMPDVVIVEMLSGEISETLEAVQRLRLDQPDTAIILTSHEISTQVILDSMRSGAQEFVARPVVPKELKKALDHLRWTLRNREPRQTRRRSTISVFSCKGGAGGSLVATNLAVALAQFPGTSVALVDLSTQLGDLSLMLDLKPRYTVADTAGGSSLEEGELRSMLTRHGSGVMLLSAVASPEDGQKIKRGHLVDMFGLLKSMFTHVVVDVERHIDDRTLEVLDLSDRILLVSTLHVPSIRNVKRYVDLFSRLEIEDRKFELVVNRHNTKKSSLRIKDLEETVGLKASWFIPNDYQTANHSIDAGVPFIIGAPRSKIAQSFQEYAASLASESGIKSEVKNTETVSTR